MRLYRFPLWVTLLVLLSAAATAGEHDPSTAENAARERAAELAPIPAPDAGPEAVVDALETALIESMRASERLDFEARRAALEPIVTRVLDVEQMGRFIFGSAWRRMEEPEQQRFVEAFTELSVATYAARFVDHAGQRFEQRGSEEQRDGEALVESAFERPDDEPIPFEYLLRRDGEQWRIVNIMTDGVSDLAVRRGEYTDAYRSDGMDAVIARIHDQIQRQVDG